MMKLRKANAKRHGSMLVELCSSLAAGSMIMLIGITLIERTMHWTQALRQHSDTQEQLRQLASTWREDFSKANKATFESDSQVVLLLPDKQIIYECKDNLVHRRQTPLGAALASSQAPASYRLGGGYQAKIQAPYLVVHSLNPAGETVNIRLRVLGQTTKKEYQVWEETP